MTPPGLLIDLGTVARDGASFSAVPLIRCDEPNPAVAVLVVVPLNECCHPCAGFLHALEGPSGVVGPVFDRAEQRFRKRVVVAHPGSGEGSEHPQLLQAAFQRGRSHGIAVVRMEDQGGFMLGGDSPTLVTHTLPTADRGGGTSQLRGC